MAILPLQLARVSNTLKTNLAQRSLTRTQQSLVEVQNQLSTGKRLNHPSDDPGNAAIALQLHRTLAERQGYQDNLKQAGSQLGEVDSTLSDLTDLLRQAQTIASANVGSDVSADQRAAAAAVVSSIYNQAVSLGNRQFQGTYVFAGDKGAQPFTTDASGIRFTGSDSVLQNSYDENTVLPFMVDGNEVFGALSTRIRGTADLTPTVTATTAITELGGAGGDGVHLGSIVLSDGSTSRTIDLSGSKTVGDMINAIDNAAVGGITASIAFDGKGLLLNAAGADSISVNELNGTTAADLGILAPTSAGPGVNVTGQPLDPKITPLTTLSELRLGAGVDKSGLVITNGQKTATVDLSAVVTVEDLLNSINASGTGVLARLDATADGIDVLNTVQGATMMIAENGGTTAADLGIRSFSAQSPLAELNGGRGVATVAGADIQITRHDGTFFTVDLSNLNTIQDVIDAINTADTGGGVTASFSATGNGIVLTDATGGGTPLAVTALNYSTAAQDLGILGSTSGATLTGKDVNGVAASGIFGNLGKLRDALITNDQNTITLAAEGLQNDLDRVTRIHGQVGAQVKEVESRQSRLDDQNLATQTLLSSLEDTDYNEAITRFQTLQTALQANLQTTGRILNLSLLDFLQ